MSVFLSSENDDHTAASSVVGFDVTFKGDTDELSISDFTDLVLTIDGIKVDFEIADGFQYDSSDGVHYLLQFETEFLKKPATYAISGKFRRVEWQSDYFIWRADGTFAYKDRNEPSPALTAKPTASTVLVNGENVAFDAYNINGNNYFKLRDLAFILNGTEKQFEVGWDGANNAISLTSGKAYTAVGGEMTGKGAGEKTPTATTSKILLDGKEVSFTAYNIEGNNYFKLRDVGQAFDFGVDWDGANNSIMIDTSKDYTAE